MLDESKYFLGALCKRGHNYQDTGLSCRYLKNSVCVECAINRSHEQVKKAQANRSYYDRTLGGEARRLALEAGDKFYLGTLCLNRHDVGDGRSRRYTQSDMCVDCCQERNRRYDPIYYSKNREKILERHREYGKTERRKELRRKAAKKHIDKRRAQEAQIHFVEFSPAEFEQRCLEFGNACAYCAKKKKLTQDHFLPVSAGGPHCLGNIVPACGNCNSSKQDSDPFDWYRRQKFYRPEQWEKILAILGKSKTNYRQIPLF